MSESKELFVRVTGTLVPVTQEIYLEYYRGERRMRYYERDIKTESAIRDKSGNITGYRPAKEDSLDRLLETGVDYADDSAGAEEIVMDNETVMELYNALNQLSVSERSLIDALFFSNDGAGMNEREYAALSGVKQQSVNERKRRVLGKLKKLLEN